MIEYIVKYQNNFVSSFLFSKNLPKLMQKGINVQDLMASSIFRYQFDFDEWPSAHYDNTPFLKPFNGSIFDLRNSYLSIFPEYKDCKDSKDDRSSSRKYFKVKYTVNLLPMIGEHVDVNDG